MPSSDPKPADLDALERMRDASVQNSELNWDAFRRYRDELLASASALIAELRAARALIATLQSENAAQQQQPDYAEVWAERNGWRARAEAAERERDAARANTAQACINLAQAELVDAASTQSSEDEAYNRGIYDVIASIRHEFNLRAEVGGK